MVKPKIVLLIFVSGKIVLTGAKVCMCECLLLTAVTRHLIRWRLFIISYNFDYGNDLPSLHSIGASRDL